MYSRILVGLTFVLSIALSTSCDGGGPAVGEGDPLPTNLTVVQLSTAMWESLGWTTPINRIIIRAVRRAMVARVFDLGLDPNSRNAQQLFDTTPCSDGGSIITDVTGSFESDATLTSTLTDCAVTVDLGTPYSETINGTASAHFILESSAGYQVENVVSLTVAGDLGFGVVCDLAATHLDSVNFTPDSELAGSCEFFDSEGTAMTGTAEDLRDLMFIGFTG